MASGVGGGPSGSGLNVNEFERTGALFFRARSALENRPSEAGAVAAAWVCGNNMNWELTTRGRASWSSFSCTAVGDGGDTTVRGGVGGGG